MAQNPVAENKEGLIGAPRDRVDGPAKVCGHATYSFEYRPQQAALYGVVVGATIAKGRIRSIDSSEAENAPGVALVLTHRNAPPQAKWQKGGKSDRHAGAKPYLASDAVRFYGEPVALVVAETFEQATFAAGRVRVEYEKDAVGVDFRREIGRATKPKSIGAGFDPDSEVGAFDKAFADAPVKVDELYATPHQNHAMMEPHASLAEWADGKLTVFMPGQLVVAAHESIARTFDLSPKKVRVVSRFIGGGFGGKLPVHPDSILAAAAAIKLGRPVKVALTRQQMFHMTTNRTASLQHVRLASDQAGKLLAIGHDATTHAARFDDFAEPAVPPTRSLYAGDNRLTRQRLVHLDLPISDSMRAPGEAIGLLAFESAMDELAVKLDIDPIELRRRNEPHYDPEKKVPFSSRHLLECFDEGARRFGWNERRKPPNTQREGRWQLGIGVAAAIRGNFLRPAEAKIRIDRRGSLVAQQAMTDIGTGSYTILMQIAAACLGLPAEKVKVEIGDSDFPPTPGSGGSFGAASAGSALYDACVRLRTTLAELAMSDDKSPLYGVNSSDIVFADGKMSLGNKAEAIADLVARNRPEGIEQNGSHTPGLEQKGYSHHAFGAHFVEVGVDTDSCEIRVRRMLGVFAAGRILNAKTARSQLIGGMIWGIGSALHEENVVDDRYGSFVHQDLANYHVPVHADIGEVDAVMLPEVDEHHNPLGIKGLGELGICGAGAAVANAIFNATGKRIREFPITLDKVMIGA